MKDKTSKTKKITFVGLSAALALLLSYVEMLIPPLFAAVPGVKIGLPNVVIIYILYASGLRSAAVVSITRILLSSLLFGNVMTFWYSLAGAVLSLTIMAILKKTDLLSTVGVSVAGGVSHNLGQILVAVFLLDTPQIAYYMIVLTFTGTVSGIFIGICGAQMIRRLPAHRFF